MMMALSITTVQPFAIFRDNGGPALGTGNGPAVPTNGCSDGLGAAHRWEAAMSEILFRNAIGYGNALDRVLSMLDCIARVLERYDWYGCDDKPTVTGSDLGEQIPPGRAVSGNSACRRNMIGSY